MKRLLCSVMLFPAAALGQLQGSWITGFDLSVPWVFGSTPQINQRFIGRVYHGVTRRISGPNQQSQFFVRHEYSRRPPFNVDDSLMLMKGNDGFWHLFEVDAQHNVQRIETLFSMFEPNWHPTNPRKFRFIRQTEILEYDVDSRVSTRITDFSGRLPWQQVGFTDTNGEGRPSADGRIWCLLASHASSFNVVGMFSYNIETDQILGTRGLSENLDHISTSLSGDYCVPSSDQGIGTRAYSLDFSEFTQLHHKSSHSDTAYDANGRDVLVVTDYQSGFVKMVDMQNGQRTDLFSLYNPNGSSYALHISGNAHENPGFAVISTYAANVNFGSPAQFGDMWGKDRVAVVELKPNPMIYNIAFTNGRDAGYFAQPHAVSNSDLTKIVFASTWNVNNEGSTSSYLISLDQDSGVVYRDTFEDGRQ